MSNINLIIELGLGKLRFFLRVGLLKLLYRGRIKILGYGWMDTGVKIFVGKGGRLELGRCEISTACKLSVESKSTLHIGTGVFFNRGCTVVLKEGLWIGSDTLFGENVKIFDHDHVHIPFLEKNRFNSKKIIIGRGCWFGSNVMVLKGVTIGDNVTVGANSVVSKDIPSNSVLTTNFSYRVKSK